MMVLLDRMGGRLAATLASSSCTGSYRSEYELAVLDRARAGRRLGAGPWPVLFEH